MRLEYFQLIDRIVDITLMISTIRVEATVPTTSTIFEEHFPRYPLMPGVLSSKPWPRPRVAGHRAQVHRMPIFAAVKQARSAPPAPGKALALSAKLLHEGSGYAVTKAEIRCDGKLACNAEITSN